MCFGNRPHAAVLRLSEGSVAYMRGNPRCLQNNMLLVDELIMGGTGINRQLPSNRKPPERDPGKYSDVYLSTSFTGAVGSLEIQFVVLLTSNHFLFKINLH